LPLAAALGGSLFLSVGAVGSAAMLWLAVQMAVR
jgi:hypothetical protein